MKCNWKQTRIWVKVKGELLRVRKCSVCGMKIASTTGKDMVCIECGGTAPVVDNYPRWRHKKLKENVEFFKYNRYKGVPIVNGKAYREPPGPW